jgi:hypothetical protein
MSGRRTAIVCVLALLAGVWWLASDDDATPARAADPVVVEVAEAPSSGELASHPTHKGAQREAAPSIGGESALRASHPTERDIAAQGANAPPATVLRGRATFRHGGPVPNLPLIAVALDAPEDVSPQHHPTLAFGRARTGDDGSFVLPLNEHGIASAAFRVRMESPMPFFPPMPWPEDDRVHAVDPEREIELVYAGAMVSIVAVDALGGHVPLTRMWVEFSGSEPRLAVTDLEGRASLPFHGTPTMTVRAVANTERLAGGPQVFELDDRSGDLEAVVQLSSKGFDAELTVEFLGLGGAPIEHFAISVRDEWDLARRYVLSENLGPGGTVSGLREGRAIVSASLRTREPPALSDRYAIYEIAVDLSSERPTHVRFVADADAGGIALEVVSDPAIEGRRLLFVRSTGEADWRQCKDIWNYAGGRPIYGLHIQRRGPHWVGGLRPGPLELSVRTEDGEELERSVVEIHAGRYVPLVLDR